MCELGWCRLTGPRQREHGGGDRRENEGHEEVGSERRVIEGGDRRGARADRRRSASGDRSGSSQIEVAPLYLIWLVGGSRIARGGARKTVHVHVRFIFLG